MSGQIVFDLETQRLAREVGGWKNIHRMGFAAGVTLDVDSLAREYRQAMGWDPQSGQPQNSILEDLKLAALVKAYG